MAHQITLDDLITANTRGQRDGQIAKARRVFEEHPEAILIQVSDEKTGRAFLRGPRRGAFVAHPNGCIRVDGVWGGYPNPTVVKIGSSTYHYQIWATWTPSDLAKYAK